MRTRYDHQLHSLTTQLIQAGQLCQNMLAQLDSRLTYQDVLPESDQNDSLERIEKEASALVQHAETVCTQLILHEQPVARDLQLITVCDRISAHLGRIAHLCLQLSAVLPYTEKCFWQSQVSQIVQTASLQLQMLLETDWIHCPDSLMAQVQHLDDRADAVYAALQQQLRTFRSQQQIDILMAAKYAERIADHCVMMAYVIQNSVFRSA